MKFLIILILLFVSPEFYSQEQNDFLNKKIEGEELKEDLSQIRKVILQSHPNPFVYVGKTSWDSTFLSLKNYFDEPRTLYDFILKTSSWLNQLKDSHIGINLIDLLYEKRGDNSWLNFRVTKIDNKFYAAYFPVNSVPFGNEIVEINDISLDTLYKQSYQFALQEGNSYSSKELYATEQIQVLYNLLYATSEKPSKIPIKHINPQGDTLFTFVETTNLKKSRELIKKFLNIDQKEVEYKIDNTNKLAILKVNSFYAANQKKYKQTIDHFFDTISRLPISKLLIDIRSNGGGYFSAVNHIFNYIDTTKSERTKNFISKRSKYDRFSSANNPWINLILIVRKSLNIGEGSKNNYHFYNLPYGSLDTLADVHITKNKFLDKKYSGKCFLAINGTSISASVDCAAWFRQIKRGEIIGEPCMGPITGTCGNPTSFYLRNTDIEILTSTMRSYTKPKFSIDIDPIIPDVLLKNTLSNFRKKIDIVHEYVINHEK